MEVTEVVRPLQKLAEGRAAMAVLGLLFGGELGEGLADLGEEEQRIVAESVVSARGVQDQAFGFAVKCCQRVSVAGDGDHAGEVAGAVFVRNFVQLAQQAGIVGLVV